MRRVSGSCGSCDSGLDRADSEHWQWGLFPNRESRTRHTHDSGKMGLYSILSTRIQALADAEQRPLTREPRHFFMRRRNLTAPSISLELSSFQPLARISLKV